MCKTKISHLNVCKIFDLLVARKLNVIHDCSLVHSCIDQIPTTEGQILLKTLLLSITSLENGMLYENRPLHQNRLLSFTLFFWLFLHFCFPSSPPPPFLFKTLFSAL